jgi:Flp pilus assembly pilin Flp
MKRTLGKFIADQTGLETIEYAVLAGFLAFVAVVGYSALAQIVSERFVETADRAGEAGAGG